MKIQDRTIPLIASLLLSLAGISHGAVTVVNFNGASDFADNFRFTSSTASTTTTQAGGFVTTNSTSGNLRNAWYAYDANGASAGTSLFNGTVTVSADFAVENSAGSFGLWIRDAASTNTTVVIINPDNSGGNEWLRVFTGGNAALGSAGTSVEISSASDLGPVIGASFSTLGVTYYENVLNPGNALVDITVGNNTFNGIAAGTFFSSGYELGVRNSDGSATAGGSSFDNFSITVPEPSIALLGSLGLLGLLRRRR